MSSKNKKGREVRIGIIVGLLIFSFPVTIWAQETTQLTYWHHEAPAHRVAAHQQVIDLFQKEHPDIKITQEVVMWGDAWPKTLAAIEAGNPPDFQYSIPDLLLTVYRANAIVPVTDIVKEMDGKHHFFPGQIAPYYHKDKYWGIPIWTMVFLLTYRPSYFEEYVGTTEPPKTWEEFLDYAEKLTQAPDLYGIGLGGAKNLMIDEQAYCIMTTMGAKFFDEKGKIIFDSPKTIKALKFYKEIFQYTPPGADAWSWGEMELNIAAGTVAMAPYFPSVQKRFHEELDTSDYAGAHMPYPPDGKPGTITYPNEIHVYKQTIAKGHLPAVEKYIEFVLRPEINYILTAVQEPGGFYPVTEAASKAPEFWKDPIITRFKKTNEVAMKALEYATLYGFEYGRWVNVGIGDITGADVLADVVHRIVTGQMSVEEAVKWGAKQMEKYSEPVG
jgi:multiple sugar transport system substrate-binding protein